MSVNPVDGLVLQVKHTVGDKFTIHTQSSYREADVSLELRYLSILSYITGLLESATTFTSKQDMSSGSQINFSL